MRIPMVLLRCLISFGLATSAVSCASSSAQKAQKDEVSASNKKKTTRALLHDSYALWEPGVKLDGKVLKRGAKARGTNNSYR